VSHHQVVNLRAGVPKMFGNAATAQAYLDDAEVQRVDMAKKGIRFAVGPAPVTVSTPSGRVIPSGQAVSVVDFHGGKEPAWKILNDLVREGRILEAEVAENEEK
jgi:hypothetical protein